MSLRLTALLLALIPTLATLPAWAEDTSAAAAQELGRLNGTALACGHREVANRIKYLMIQKSPKTPTFGNAFEAATQEAFVARTRDAAPCPEAPELARQAEVAAERLPSTEAR